MTSAPRSTAGGAMPFDVHGARAVRRARASTASRRGLRPAGAATSSPRRRSGPLFGAVVARFLDAEWERLGRPDPFTVVDAGAGPGTLARAVARRPTGLLRRAALRRRRGLGGAAGPPPGRGRVRADLPPRARSTAWSSPTSCSTTCRSGSPCSTRAGARPTSTLDRYGRLRRGPVGAVRSGARRSSGARPYGARAPLPDARRPGWPTHAALLNTGRAAVHRLRRAVDGRAGRPWRDWLRTYRVHERGDHYLPRPGQPGHHRRRRPRSAAGTRRRSFAGPVPAAVGHRRAGGRRRAGLDRQAARPDLAAMRMRSRVSEAEALLDPSGLGRFLVAEWRS